MQVTVAITEDGKPISTATVDLSHWRAMGPGLRLLASVLNSSLAHTYVKCVSSGMNMFLEEYSQAMQATQKKDFRRRIGTGQ